MKKKKKPKIFTERINLKVEPEMKAELEQRAKDEGRSLSNYIKQLLREAIQN
ncbi:MAG: ribbon-helix-helix protein, CopG family [Chitinophagales bacterium]|nr:ribbon-helix-helix protein, CopG family [Chitinophagales bacterium]